MSPQVTRYHHGDLRPALIDAALDLARSGGPGALRLREITRAAGVSPNAAYRHFPDLDALVLAAAQVAQDRLAAAMREQIGALLDDAGGTADAGARDTAAGTADAGAADSAIARLRGVGLGYIHFAIAEPGWFELALLTFDPRSGGDPTVTVGNEVPPPFQLLLDALDHMVAVGALTVEERVHAEWPCWSAVHGFADLAARGPLKHQPPDVLSALGEHVVDRAIAGVRAHV
ncbi:WHG domain-containing protein [Demequina sp. TTPB684]|uniref:TetR-like C-terminal domain-containing protein n=1 Tax=unclassified Demequina TaxID=2620311 RepID=UPI001CF2E86C|nr:MULTISPECIES: TetR-like C-terminal domain-containing protein [unclassified Demequina]MCB2413463.1 WHG domain-containing protein [Demequina sp. TTPB684]UPU88766.1 WHG domain-containing protein [Demequina sp. TMPB413]